RWCSHQSHSNRHRWRRYGDDSNSFKLKGMAVNSERCVIIFQNARHFITRVLKNNHALLFLLLLSGCASMTKEECASEDWSNFAKTKFLMTPQSVNSIYQSGKKACEEHHIVPDQEAIKRGYIAGVNEFCQAKNIWERGLQGDKVNLAYCPRANRPRLERVLQASNQLYEIERAENEVVQLQQKINGLIQESYALENNLDHLYRSKAPQQQIDQARANLQKKRDEIAQNQNKLSSLSLKITQMRRRARSFDQAIR